MQGQISTVLEKLPLYKNKTGRTITAITNSYTSVFINRKRTAPTACTGSVDLIKAADFFAVLEHYLCCAVERRITICHTAKTACSCFFICENIRQLSVLADRHSVVVIGI